MKMKGTWVHAQVQLEDGRLVAVADPQNVIREATRGAEGKDLCRITEKGEADKEEEDQRPIPSKINTKGNRSGLSDWWKIPIPSRYNTKRKFLKGSTDVYLPKRTDHRTRNCVTN